MKYSPLVLFFMLSAAFPALAETAWSVQTTNENASIEEGGLVLRWVGDIEPPMAESLENVLKSHGDKKLVIIDLSSEGGRGGEGERVIEVLGKARDQGKKIRTVVGRGAVCASMCGLIFLQGDERWGALVSSWMFHGARPWYTTMPNREQTEMLLDKYFRSRGVSENFLSFLLGYVLKPGEYWMTGEEMHLQQKSGFFHKVYPKYRELPVESAPMDPQIRSR